MPPHNQPYAPPESPPSEYLSKGLRSASVPVRMVAIIIDYLLTAAAIYGSSWVAYLLGWRGELFLLPTMLVLAKPICEACGGRTPGKALLGARVVDQNRLPIGPWAAIVRNLGWVLGPGIGSFLAWVMMVGGIPAGIGGMVLSSLALIGCFCLIVSGLAACGRSKRAFHDRLAGTFVLQGWSPAAIISSSRRRRRNARP